MTRCPASFSGTIDEFYTRYVLPNLPAVNTVFAFHRAVVEYCAAPDPLFRIRHVSGTERGKVITTRTGAHVKPTDNAPAWWFHHALFHGTMFDAPSLAAAIESAPAHFFEVAAQTPDSINAARCHVAHILPVKDGNTAYLEWDHAELTARFVRNVHPCNYFFVATTGWQRWGGDPHIIGYFADRYAASRDSRSRRTARRTGSAFPD